MKTIASRSIAAATEFGTTANTEMIDPLLILLRRYEAQILAFDQAHGTDRMTESDWDSLAKSTWYRTRDEILQQEPPATTAAGALLALDHVLQNDDLFAERTECAEQQMLWLMIRAARDYIASAGTQGGSARRNDFGVKP